METDYISVGDDCTSLHDVSLDSVAADDKERSRDYFIDQPGSQPPNENNVHKSFESELAIDQTWGEWMQELPGNTWSKICQFTSLQWKWSRNLVSYAHLPEWLKDNKFLLSHHRLPIYSFTGCILSAFRCHTETGNIWTHLVGSLMTLVLAIYCFSTRLHKLHWTEQIVYAIFFLSGILCMGFSCMFHTVINHSPKMFKLFSRLDYLGIALLIVGSNIPWLYYAHFCRPLVYVIYNVAFIVVGIAGTIVTLWSEFDKPKYRTLRGIVFLAMGLTAVVPGLHFTIMYGWSSAMEQASLGWMILMGCFYISGTTLYMLQVPERFFPGKFDIFFQSHQIMHVCVFIAVCVCYHAISLLEYKHTDAIKNGTLCTNNILNITKWT